MKDTLTGIQRIHPFERAAFGHAPYRYVGHYQAVFQAAPDAPRQPGTSCDYCGTGIMDVFKVRSSDGVEFKVGCDCIRKVSAEFDGDIPPDAREWIYQMESAKRHERRLKRDAQIKARKDRVRGALAAHPTLFVDRPHPTPFYAAQGRTLRDYYQWCLDHKSNDVHVFQIIERAVA